MMSCFINGLGCVSAQDTTEAKTNFDNFSPLNQNVVAACKPDYKSYIKPAMIRRMANGVKMGVVASSLALYEAGIDLPKSIITGTGMGCLKDSEKFLKSIIDNKEEFLTPTAFIQSTHNTVGAQIALGLGCKAYNITYVHTATSFESSLIDAGLMLDEGQENVLVGGVDELGSYTTDLHKLIDHVKEEKTLSAGILASNSKGAIFSEGAQFFVLEKSKSDNSYAQLRDVEIINTIAEENIEKRLNLFLKNNNLDISDIDIFICGNNGDVEYDNIYSNLQKSCFKNTQQLYYKHLSGEYNTVSAFGLYTACNIIKDQKVPKILKLNEIENETFKNVLLYNQYRGENHSFTLLSSC
jgi:3-oxoacyl-(acyl-carrier-protein) synthase